MEVPADRLPVEWREYRLMRMFGWSYQDYENAPAAKCDHYLEIDAVLHPKPKDPA